MPVGYQLNNFSDSIPEVQMRVAIITRSTLYQIHGGSAVQVLQTAKELNSLGIETTIFLAHEKIDYDKFDLLHFFDLTRPSNILYHTTRTQKPYVVSPLLVDYSEYDKKHRKGLSGFLLQFFSTNGIEYVKTIGRWILNKDSLQSKKYLLKGQLNSIKEVLRNAAFVLPNSEMEYQQLRIKYNIDSKYLIIPNGVDLTVFVPNQNSKKDEKLVICAARFEGIKNQLNMIKALNQTEFKVKFIGGATPNQKNYLEKCKRLAANNIEFIPNIEQEMLVEYYQLAKVHVLPSWFETCGLSSLEAATMGCNIVISNRGFSKEYFSEHAFYCDPESPDSILNAVKRAASAPRQSSMQLKIINNFTWEKAASKTAEAYKRILN
jgi:glycosyltransferase involved in cell wall biosynthesis